MLEPARLRLREHGLEWLLELSLPAEEAEEILVYLDAVESGRDFRTPQRLVAPPLWIALFDEDGTRRFVRFNDKRAVLSPSARRVLGWSIQGAGRAPIERVFDESTLAVPWHAVTVVLADDGMPRFEGLYFDDAVALAILRDIDLGGCALEMIGPTWDEIYDGRPLYRIADGRWRGVEIAVFKDAGSWDYVEAIRLPDGRSDRIDSDVVLEWQPTNPSPWEDAPPARP